MGEFEFFFSEFVDRFFGLTLHWYVLMFSASLAYGMLVSPIRLEKSVFGTFKIILHCGVFIFIAYVSWFFFFANQIGSVPHKSEWSDILFEHSPEFVLWVIALVSFFIFEVFVRSAEEILSHIPRRLSKPVRRAFRDRRFTKVAAALIFTVSVATALAMSFENDTILSGGLYSSFYASWTEDIIFFSIVGLAVAVASFGKPEDEKFERRVGILFAGSDPNVLKYNTDEIRKMACYANQASRTITFEKYLPDIDAFQVDSVTIFELENLLETEYEDSIGFRHVPDRFDDINGHNYGEIKEVSLTTKTNSIEVMKQLFDPSSFGSEGFNEHKKIQLESDGNGKLKIHIKCLMKCDELQVYSSQRYVENFELELINDAGCVISFNEANEDESFQAPIEIAQGLRRNFTKKSLKAKNVAFNFKVNKE